MQLSPTLWVSISLSLLCIVLVVVLWIYVKNVKTKLMQAVGLIDELYKLNTAQSATIEALKSKVMESTKVSKALKKDYQSFNVQVEEKLNKVADTVERLEEQDPELKMYSKASKLVEQGAAMEDIIEASGLPRAEVEVLMSLHAKSKHTNQ